MKGTRRQRRLTKDHRRIMDAMRSRIREERQRQIDGEGYHPDDDDRLDRGELACAAVLYAAASLNPGLAGKTAREQALVQMIWPFPDRPARLKSRERNLERACALLLAELERLERQRERAGRQAAERLFPQL